MLAEASQSVDMSTDSESVAAESGLSESESEAEPANVQELRAPLDRGWKRETIIKGLTKSGQIRGDVYYFAPHGGQTKIKNFTQLEPLLAKQTELTRDNFSFSARPLVGMFLQAPPFPPDADYIRMTDEDVGKRLEELKMFTRHSQLDVEQRIEIAKQQQAMRDAKKLAKDEMARNKEKAKQVKEQEKTERLEAQRKERELKTQQAVEVSEGRGKGIQMECRLLKSISFRFDSFSRWRWLVVWCGEGSTEETGRDGKVKDGGDAEEATGNCGGRGAMMI